MKRLRIVLWLCLPLLGLPELAHASTGGWLNDRHEEICRAHGGARLALRTLPNARDMTTCTADCFRYDLFCYDGTKTILTARYRPEASDADVFFSDGAAGSIVKWVVAALIAFYGFAATYGRRDDRDEVIIINAIAVPVFLFTLWMWGVRATAANGWGLGAAFDFLLSPLIMYIAFPVFMALMAPSFIRGCNYLFVRHPAAGILSQRKNRGKSVDLTKLADTLAAGAADPGVAATFHYEHQADQARVLAEKLQAEAAMTEALAERERRRAEFEEAERLLTEARRRSEGMA
jgi:hypothetical protein